MFGVRGLKFNLGLDLSGLRVIGKCMQLLLGFVVNRVWSCRDLQLSWFGVVVVWSSRGWQLLGFAVIRGSIYRGCDLSLLRVRIY